MRFTTIVLGLGALTASLSACSDGVTGLFRSSRAASTFRADADRYTLVATAVGLETRIPFSFRNETGAPIYVVNCNRHAPPALEKREGDRWVVAWNPVVPQCLSAPIVIAAGATYQDTLYVFAGHPEGNHYPKFETTTVDGTYRLRWYGVLRSFNPNRHPFGESVPEDLLRSESFVLEAPR